MYNICKCSSNLHQHIKIRIKNVPGDWDETIVPGGPGPCPQRAVTHARGTAERSEHRAVGMGLKLVTLSGEHGKDKWGVGETVNQGILC